MSTRTRVWRNGREVDPPSRRKRAKETLIDPLATQIKRGTKQQKRDRTNDPDFYAVPGRSRARMVSGGLPSLSKKSR
jgi:hypothetical protein